MVLLRIPTAVEPETGIEWFQTLFARDFATMGSSSLNPHAQFLVNLAEWPGAA